MYTHVPVIYDGNHSRVGSRLNNGNLLFHIGEKSYVDTRNGPKIQKNDACACMVENFNDDSGGVCRAVLYPAWDGAYRICFRSAAKSDSSGYPVVHIAFRRYEASGEIQVGERLGGLRSAFQVGRDSCHGPCIAYRYCRNCDKIRIVRADFSGLAYLTVRWAQNLKDCYLNLTVSIILSNAFSVSEGLLKLSADVQARKVLSPFVM